MGWSGREIAILSTAEVDPGAVAENISEWVWEDSFRHTDQGPFAAIRGTDFFHDTIRPTTAPPDGSEEQMQAEIIKNADDLYRIVISWWFYDSIGAELLMHFYDCTLVENRDNIRESLEDDGFKLVEELPTQIPTQSMLFLGLRDSAAAIERAGELTDETLVFIGVCGHETGVPFGSLKPEEQAHVRKIHGSGTCNCPFCLEAEDALE